MLKKTSKKEKSVRNKRGMYFPAKRKILDNMKLLISDQEFKAEIKKIRDRINIPIGGFHKDLPDRYEKYNNWDEDMCEKSDRIMNNSGFWEKLKELKEQLDRGEINEEQHDSKKAKFDDLIPLSYLTRKIRRIVKEFNLPANYYSSIHHYIIFNEISIPIIPFMEIIEPGQNKTQKSVTIQFFMKLTDADLKHLKHYINNLAGKDLPSLNPLKDIDTKIEIEESYKDKEKFNEGEQEYYTMSAKEISKNISKKVKPEQVYEAVRELRDLRQKRFRKGLGKSME
jgi:hypothetical protein